jgi:phage terminase small subunit
VSKETDKPKKPKLTTKQARFVSAMLDPVNKGVATTAAIKAGYSEESAKVLASQTLTNINVREALFAEGSNLYAVDSSSLKTKISRVLSRIERLLDAADRELTDPNDSEAYTLAPRTEEIQVVYLDHRDADDKGKPKRKTAPLYELLEQVERNLGHEILKARPVTTDPRKLLLEASKEIRESFKFVSDIAGLAQKPKENEQDAEARREFWRTQIAEIAVSLNGDEAEAKAWLFANVPEARSESQWIN